ncbi:AT-rich interactive domain-containing protein 3A [Denticeps clupeoides]|uniref:AT-rich interactive domain-containing protein 3 n=1 Tax=Denticeps clupeoides TaxID=299321 RepID=A0AAY4CRU8_9TELE|nr:AT-rich interactive domain-containing protein 3A [Denticeps clupeoides]
MKLQAVMENLHRQQRAKLMMVEQQQQQPPPGPQGGGPRDDELTDNPPVDTERAQMAALAAMRAAAAGLQRPMDSPRSASSGGEEDEEDEDEREGTYKDMMGSEEEEQIKQKWDEEDFDGDMEDDYDDDLGDEGLPAGREAAAPGKGILLLPHRQLHPGTQLPKPRPPGDPQPRGAAMPGHTAPNQPAGQDHGDWTYEEQFRQLYELDGDPKRKEFLDDLFSFMQKRGTPVNRIPIMAKQVLDLYMLYQLVTEKGGLVEVINKKLWREITKGLNLPTSITSAAFTLRTQYMKYLYPYECDKRGLSNPNELQAAIDSNRREGRRQSFGNSLFTYSPNGTPTMLSSQKLAMPSLGMAAGTNGASLAPVQKVKKEEDVGQPLSVASRLPGALAGPSVAAVQAAAAQAAMAAQVAALEQLRDKLEAGEPPEKKMALPAEEQQRLLQRALQHNLLAMTTQMPMNIRINSQEGRQDSALNLTTNGMSSISMSVELNGVVYTGVLFAQGAGAASSSGASGTAANSNHKAPGVRAATQATPHMSTSSSS